MLGRRRVHSRRRAQRLCGCTGLSLFLFTTSRKDPALFDAILTERAVAVGSYHASLAYDISNSTRKPEYVPQSCGDRHNG